MIHWWEKWSDDEKADIFAHFMHEFPSNIMRSDLKTQALRNPPDFKKQLLAIDIAESLKNSSLIFEDVFPLCTWLNQQ